MKNLLNNPSAFFLAIALFIGSPLCSLAQRDSSAAIHIGFIYPVSSNGKQAASITNRFSLHVIAGLSKGETGAAIAGVANVVKENVSGVQMAGVANVIGGSASGVQMSGVANVTGGDARGAQLAGFSNITRGEAQGAQLAGFLNLAEASGAAQVAGFANIAKKDAKGLQLAGFFNKGNEVNVQIAGFANVAKKVKGIQLAGLINIADSSDYPIAIFNFIKNGEKSVAVTFDETMTGIVSFRSGGRVLYGIAGIGYNFKDNPKAMYAAEGGLGAHIPLARSLRINLEAVSHTLTDFDGGHYNKNSLRVLPALRLGSRFEAFAGPTLNYVSYDREKDYDFIKKYIWKNNSSKDFQGLFVGFNVGVQYLF
ncbi:MAG: hypothetical protein BGO21_31200 [Dyadobacter sp. 50-39]|uniref:hypothetical protein n=1 Tax=Dyadobacter sp. 50-39 TaxID=1895756 RepID=UPI00095B0752|nr:hypothetical protein [Dyadobacter sp. 50-39]OJV15459.1 MAG: hypothetical protein BGO21_31200 [Dyadobacter sp. 50-39]